MPIEPPPVQNNPDQDDPSNAAASVIAEQLPDGSLAITIPTNVQNFDQTPMVQPQIQQQQILPASAPIKQNELKCLQNLLPSCQFEHCTININTMGQTQSTN